MTHNIRWYTTEIADIEAAARERGDPSIQKFVHYCVSYAIQHGLSPEKTVRLRQWGIPDDQKQDLDIVGIRWKKQENESLKAAAIKARMNISDYVRHAVAAQLPRPEPADPTLAGSFQRAAMPYLKDFSDSQLIALQGLLAEEMARRFAPKPSIAPASPTSSTTRRPKSTR